MLNSKSILLLLSFGIGYSIQCQTVNSDCSGSDSIVKKYRSTADKLAILRSTTIGDTYKDSVTINPQMRISYLKALIAVYNATALPARDTIIFFNITLDHKYWPYSALNTFLLEGDSAMSWVANLRQNITPSGHSGIDSLMSKYYVKVTGSSIIWPPSSFNPFNIRFGLKTDTNYFISRLCDRFNALYLQGAGVGNASPQSAFSDSYNITDSVNLNFTELNYSVGWGDCMAGCIYRRYWRFKVFNDCSVEYQGSYGDPVPPEFFTGLHETSGLPLNLTVYPNPARNSLYLLPGVENIPRLLEIRIVSADGRTVFENKTFNAESGNIDVSSFRDGIYFLRIMGSNVSLTQKIIICR